MNASDIAARRLRGSLNDQQFRFLCATHNVTEDEVNQIVNRSHRRAAMGFLIDVIFIASLIWLLRSFL